MTEYEKLIDSYRVESVAKIKISDAIAYCAGFFLLISPFIPKLAAPMAVITLSYFIATFSALAAKDLLIALKTRAQNIHGLLLQYFSLLSWKFKVYNAVLESFVRYVFAFFNARALWEMLFFSLRVAWAKVLPSSSK